VIEFSGEKIEGETLFEITNAIGQIIYSDEENVTASFKKEIQLNNVSSGIYFISIKSNTVSPACPACRFQQKILISK
jgi:hypothetical protein